MSLLRLRSYSFLPPPSFQAGFEIPDCLVVSGVSAVMEILDGTDSISSVVLRTSDDVKKLYFSNWIPRSQVSRPNPR